jgi:hypothetical protein
VKQHIFTDEGMRERERKREEEEEGGGGQECIP